MRRLKEHNGKMPYIQEMNLVDEEVVVVNPRTIPFDLRGIYLQTDKDSQIFHFPEDGYILPAGKCVTVYSCPGKHLPNELARPALHLLWTTSTGAPRKGEVLNNDGDVMYLKRCTGSTSGKNDVVLSELRVDRAGHIVTQTSLNLDRLHIIPSGGVRALLYLRVAMELAACYALMPFKVGPLLCLWIIAFVADFLILELGCYDARDNLTGALSGGADVVHALSTLAALVLTSSHSAGGLGMAGVIAALIASDALSAYMFNFRASLLPYLDTVTLVLQRFLYLPKLVGYCSQLYVLLVVADGSGLTKAILPLLSLPSGVLDAMRTSLLLCFVVRHVLSFIQLADACHSIARRL